MVQMFANMTDAFKFGPRAWRPRFWRRSMVPCSPTCQPDLAAARQQAARQAARRGDQPYPDYRRQSDDPGFQESALVREMLLAHRREKHCQEEGEPLPA